MHVSSQIGSVSKVAKPVSDAVQRDHGIMGDIQPYGYLGSGEEHHGGSRILEYGSGWGCACL